MFLHGEMIFLFKICILFFIFSSSNIFFYIKKLHKKICKKIYLNLNEIYYVIYKQYYYLLFFIYFLLLYEIIKH